MDELELNHQRYNYERPLFLPLVKKPFGNRLIERPLVNDP